MSDNGEESLFEEVGEGQAQEADRTHTDSHEGARGADPWGPAAPRRLRGPGGAVGLRRHPVQGAAEEARQGGGDTGRLPWQTDRPS